MIAWRVDIEAQDRDGDGPLALAAMKGFRMAVEMLVDMGADIEAKSKENRTALHHASSQGHADLVDFLLDNGAPINAQTIYGQTPLNRAAVKGRLDVTKLLVERKADFELPDRWGATPLFRAARNNRKDIVEYLISVGADMDSGITESHNGDFELNTALHTAAWRGHSGVVEVLLRNWADYTKTNAAGDTPAMAAATADKEAIADQIHAFQEGEQRSCPVVVRRMKVENTRLKAQVEAETSRLREQIEEQSQQNKALMDRIQDLEVKVAATIASSTSSEVVSSNSTGRKRKKQQGEKSGKRSRNSGRNK